jgi:hypothetical protein
VKIANREVSTTILAGAIELKPEKNGIDTECRPQLRKRLNEN